MDNLPNAVIKDEISIYPCKQVLPAAQQAVLWERAVTAMKYPNLFGTAGDRQKSKEKALNPPSPQLQRKMVSKFQTVSIDKVDMF